MPENRVRVGTVMTWSSEGASSAVLQIRVAESAELFAHVRAVVSGLEAMLPGFPAGPAPSA